LARSLSLQILVEINYKSSAIHIKWNPAMGR
jgi:hypothetical protein